MSSNAQFTFDFSFPISSPFYSGFNNDFDGFNPFGDDSLACILSTSDLVSTDLLPSGSMRPDSSGSAANSLLTELEHDDPEWLSKDRKTQSTETSYSGRSNNYFVNLLRSDGYDIPDEADTDDEDDEAAIKARIAAADYYFQDKSDIFTPSYQPPTPAPEPCDSAMLYQIAFNERGPLTARELRELTQEAQGEQDRASDMTPSETGKAKPTDKTSTLVDHQKVNPRQAQRRVEEEDLTWVKAIESTQPLPQDRQKFQKFLLEEGDIGTLFPYSLSEEISETRRPQGNRPGKQECYYLCRATQKWCPNAHKWVDSTRCGKPFRGSESWLRHLKTVHLGMPRDGSTLDLNTRFGIQEKSKSRRKRKARPILGTSRTQEGIDDGDDDREEERAPKRRRIQ